MKCAWWLVTKTTREQQGQRRGEEGDLRVAVELQGVVLGHAALHAAGGVHDEHVEAAEALGDGREHRVDALRVGEVGAHREGRAARGLDLLDELLGALLLVAVVHDHGRAGLGEVANRVGPDAPGRAGDQGTRAGEGSCGEGVGHGGGSSLWGGTGSVAAPGWRLGVARRPVRAYRPTDVGDVR
jgi:hypothetical protein